MPISDIDGLMYPDMPWMVSGDSSRRCHSQQRRQAWGNARRLAQPPVRLRLRRLPADAGDVRAHQRLADVQIAGLTGQLHFDAGRRVQRDLIWVQVRDGEPKQVCAAPAPDSP